AFALHLPKVRAFVDARAPVQLVLPAFPAKAPNPRKVLGALPDAAEWIALESLAELLDEIAEAHPPGARLVICSDGGVFADVVGVTDGQVAAYRAELAAMIAELGADIRIFGLEDAFGEASPRAARKLLLERWAPAVGEIRARAARAPQHAAQLDGIHRFLFEDEVARAPGLSRSQARKQTRERAYEVVRRSEAWGRLVGAAFPGAVRLSIHPQPDVSDKVGVELARTDDAWLTPWHAAAVLGPSGFSLAHRADAERVGARVVEEDGRPSYLTVSA
ncbi:MAG TPA: isocyanide synthase family protein, partial [Minicystis sp.]|nr:isocyanide synthase family protein [Minicystis sp.]